MRSSRTARMLALGGAFGALGMVVVACSLSDVDFTKKGCPCGPGYVCDTARDLCVLPSDLPSGDASSGGIDAQTDGPGSDGATQCSGPGCACNVEGDCKNNDFKHCSSAKKCVECVAQTDCRAGTYCNGSNQCVLGCKQESDCQISPGSPHCDVTRHQCVECRSKTDCTGADECSPSGQCVAGCNPDAGQNCTGGKSCCGGLCIDTTKDLLNCGGCGTACSTANGTPTCAASACSWACANGFAHCSTTNTGCETNTKTDATKCGSCTTNCNTLVANATGIVCNGGTCNYTACAAEHDDCDTVRTNGCECTCGSKKLERCCPGNVCTAPLTCLGSGKCN